MSALLITLPGLPPSTNARYWHNRRGDMGLTGHTAAWQAGAALAIKTCASNCGWVVAPRTPLTLQVRFLMPRLFARDVDNMQKALFDAVAAGLAIDDRYFVDVHIRKERGRFEETQICLDIVHPSAPSPQAQIARRMETYAPPIEGELAFREACQAAGVQPIPAHPTALSAAQAAAVLRILPEGGRRIWPHEVGEG